MSPALPFITKRLDLSSIGISTRPFTLRLSVTERCNLRCRYCMPPGIKTRTSRRDLPSLDALAETVEWLNDHLSLSKIKITGGEPLVRPGLTSLAGRLSSRCPDAELSLTTNGTHLARLAAPLKEAGLCRVNVSLDSLDPNRFRELTQGDLKQTLSGIEAAIEVGLTPLKLNSVLRQSSWKEDVPALLDYAAAHDIEIRFIELMQIGPAAQWASREFVSAQEVRNWLFNHSVIETLHHPAGEPARRETVSWHGKQSVVGWITPRSEPFCDGCNRLRLDSYGNLRRCLMDAESLPLLNILETRHNDGVPEELSAYLNEKRPSLTMATSNRMAAVGG
jgi:GTP 3',8-cyclase